MQKPLGILFLLMVTYFSCQIANAYDLVSSYQNALTYNADYLAAIAKNQAGQESQVQGRSALLPQINGSGTINENYLSSGGANFYYHQPLASLQLQQVAYDFGKFSQYTKSKYATKVADLQLVNVKQQLIVNVAQGYFDVLYAKDVLSAISLTKSALAKQLNQAKKSFDAGTVTIADVNDAQSGFDSASAQEIQAENDLINKKNIFRNLTGLDPEQIQTLVNNIELTNPNPNSVDKWSEMAKVNNLNVKIADTQLAMANEDISIARSGHIPTLNVAVNGQSQGALNIDGADSANTINIINQSANVPGSTLSSYNSVTAGVQVNVPIYSGGAVNSQIRQAHSNYEASKQQLVSTQRQTDQNIKNAFWQVQNGVEIVKAQTQALKSAKVKLDSDRTGYQVGVRNSIDLVNSEKNYADAIQNYNKARYQYLIYRLQLRYLAGDIDTDFLKLINVNIESPHQEKKG